MNAYHFGHTERDARPAATSTKRIAHPDPFTLLHRPLSATLTTSPPATDPQEPDSEGEDQPGDTDAIYDLSFQQAGDLILHDTTVYAAVVELLLELEDVDPEPDFWARSSKGPWHIAVNEDCGEALATATNLNPGPRIDITHYA
eukprot:scaffold56392_cov32-Tisochrysis_lutea.AAC.1